MKKPIRFFQGLTGELEEIEDLRFPRALLHTEPRLAKLQICMYAIIDGECRGFGVKAIPYNQKYLKTLAAAIVRSSVHEDSIERAVKQLCRRKWIVPYDDDKIIWLGTAENEPSLKGMVDRFTKVPLEAMANPNLSYTAKLAFGQLHRMLLQSRRVTMSNKLLAEEIYVRRRSLESAIPELEKQRYICIRNAKTQWRVLSLYPKWNKTHKKYKISYKSLPTELWTKGACRKDKFSLK